MCHGGRINPAFDGKATALACIQTRGGIDQNIVIYAIQIEALARFSPEEARTVLQGSIVAVHTVQRIVLPTPPTHQTGGRRYAGGAVGEWNFCQNEKDRCSEGEVFP